MKRNEMKSNRFLKEFWMELDEDERQSVFLHGITSTRR